MRINLTIPTANRRDRILARLRALDGIGEVHASANLTEAYHQIEHQPPNIAIFSEDMTLQPEFEVLQHVMTTLRVRSVVLASRRLRNADRAGVFADQGLHAISDDMDDAALLQALRRTARPRLEQATPKRVVATSAARNSDRVIMIGSSTGGVEALIQVLSAFPGDCPPTFLVQHTGGSFSGGLARLLNSKCGPQVREAEDGMPVAPGTVVLAPGDQRHLTVKFHGKEPRCRLMAGAARCGHRPSVDALFESGVAAASRVTAAILTGMGRDGAEGLLALKNAGARTFGQDEETSLVYGMPKVAADRGAVQRQLPLQRIGPSLIAASKEQTTA